MTIIFSSSEHLASNPDPKLIAADSAGVAHSASLVPLQSMLCTQASNRRPGRAPNDAMENYARLALAFQSAVTALPPEQQRRVLVVDDNVDVAHSLALLLQATGHEVRVAYDGPSAVDAALEFGPDMAVIDIGLPGISGLEVARRIRKLAAIERLVLVAMTGYGQAADRANSLEAGFDHHLVKPVDFNQVQTILSEIALNAA